MVASWCRLSRQARAGSGSESRGPLGADPEIPETPAPSRPDLAGKMAGIFPIPDWAAGMGKIFGILPPIPIRPGFREIGESRFGRDRENKPRCPGIGDFGAWLGGLGGPGLRTSPESSGASCESLWRWHRRSQAAGGAGRPGPPWRTPLTPVGGRAGRDSGRVVRSGATEGRGRLGDPEGRLNALRLSCFTIKPGLTPRKAGEDSSSSTAPEHSTNPEVGRVFAGEVSGE